MIRREDNLFPGTWSTVEPLQALGGSSFDIIEKVLADNPEADLCG